MKSKGLYSQFFDAVLHLQWARVSCSSFRWYGPSKGNSPALSTCSRAMQDMLDMSSYVYWLFHVVSVIAFCVFV